MVEKLNLDPAEKLQLRQATERLSGEFRGVFNVETIERFINDSLDRLLSRATVSQWLPLLAERFARERLRAAGRLEHKDTRVPGILFLCTHNAGRSQMGAGFARALGGDEVDVFSGGTEPASQINSQAVAAMAEVGIDISDEFPQPWTDEIVQSVDVVVTMGCGDACPVIPGKRYVDWELTDPAGLDLAEVRPIRDEIRERVAALLDELRDD